MTLPFSLTGDEEYEKRPKNKGKYVKKKANLRVGWKEQTDIVNNISIVFLAVQS